MKIINDIEQRSLAWYQARAGKFTGSDFYIVMGKKGTTRTNLILEKACERLNNYIEEDNFTNKYMQKGIDLEPKARFLYEIKTNNKVEEIAFCELDDFTGCSPDGLVGDDGIIEIKSVKSTTYLGRYITKKIPTEYMVQIQFNLFVLNRKWCDFINYNENFKDKPILIQRVERDEEMIEEIKAKLEEAKQEVNEIIEKFKKE